MSAPMTTIAPRATTSAKPSRRRAPSASCIWRSAVIMGPPFLLPIAKVDRRVERVDELLPLLARHVDDVLRHAADRDVDPRDERQVRRVGRIQLVLGVVE